jgi:NAD(P)-dependent dehydrogenase (short-subunit alcohol dehydrogenase family)
LTTVKVNYIANNYMTWEYLAKRVPQGGAIGYISSSGGHGWNVQGCREELMPLVQAKGWDETLSLFEALPGVEEKPGALGYAVSKRALNLFAALMTAEFGKKKIRVNCLLPGPTQSGLTEDFVAMSRGIDNMLKNAGYAQRLAESREMAEPIVFLNSRMATYISGILMEVDFGLYTPVAAGMTPEPFRQKLLSQQGG